MTPIKKVYSSALNTLKSDTEFRSMVDTARNEAGGSLPLQEFLKLHQKFINQKKSTALLIPSLKPNMGDKTGRFPLKAVGGLALLGGVGYGAYQVKKHFDTKKRLHDQVHKSSINVGEGD